MQTRYNKLSPIYKPLIFGMTASPTNDLNELSVLMGNAKFSCPIIYKESITQPRIEYYLYETSLVDLNFQESVKNYISVMSRNLKIQLAKSSWHISKKDLVKAREANLSNDEKLIEHLLRIKRCAELAEVCRKTASKLLRDETSNYSSGDLNILDPYSDLTSQDVSPRTQALLSAIDENIKIHTDDIRILIFVKTRRKSMILKQILEERTEYKSFRPSYIVGHGGCDGMSWEDEQSEILKKFTLFKRSNLLNY